MVGVLHKKKILKMDDFIPEQGRGCAPPTRVGKMKQQSKKSRKEDAAKQEMWLPLLRKSSDLISDGTQPKPRRLTLASSRKRDLSRSSTNTQTGTYSSSAAYTWASSCGMLQDRIRRSSASMGAAGRMPCEVTYTGSRNNSLERQLQETITSVRIQNMFLCYCWTLLLPCSAMHISLERRRFSENPHLPSTRNFFIVSVGLPKSCLDNDNERSSEAYAYL
jgi:hypothetical protein